jgi:transcriptional regulator with XRE-family HTH domain
MKKLTPKELGNILKKLRLSKQLSQTDLARILKVSPTTISSIEIGRSYPSLSMLFDLASVLGYPSSVLLGEKSLNEVTSTQTEISLRLISRIKTLLDLVPEETLIKYLDALIDLCKETKEQVSKSNS